VNGKRLLAICLLCTALGNIVPRANAFINLGNGVFKSDGSHDDTQAAVNAAPVGGTVLLPYGTFTWTKTVFVVKSLNIFGESVSSPTTILNNHPNPTSFQEKGIITMSSSAGVNAQIKNIHFRIGPNISGAYQGLCQLWFARGSSGGILLLHDCTFDANATIAKGLRLYQNGAVIWNCTFNATGASYVDGIAIQYVSSDTYRAPSTMGVLDKTGVANCYVEDSKFNNISPGYSLDMEDGARFVVRHCAFTNSYIGSHGQETGPFGMRHAEVYNCTFTNPNWNIPTQAALWMRGGTWVIFNNTFGPIPYGKATVMMQILSLSEGIYYLGGTHVFPTHYPIPRQIGQGWIGAGGYSYPDLPQDGGGYTTDPVYIWSNTPSVPSVAFGNLLTGEFIKAGRDYFIGTPKPGYVPYLYPHPLRATAK
jgi:hypothetical protein